MLGRGNPGPVHPWFGKDIREGGSASESRAAAFCVSVAFREQAGDRRNLSLLVVMVLTSRSFSAPASPGQDDQVKNLAEVMHLSRRSPMKE